MVLILRAPALRSGVDAAVDRKVGAVDEGRLRTGDEGYQGCDLVGVSKPIKRNGRLLACGPLAGGGVQIGVDGPRLNVEIGRASCREREELAVVGGGVQ